MTTLTLSIDEALLGKVQEIAARRKTTVDAMVRDVLQTIAGEETRLAETRRRLADLIDNSTAQLGPDYVWNRQDIYEDRGFLDTNVLIYAAAGKKRDPEKHAIARKLITESRFAVSGQVLAEFYVNVVQKAHIRLSPAQADEWIELLSGYPVVPIDTDIVLRAITLSRRYVITYWDAALLAAAERLEAPILYTEDLNHDQLYGSVRVVNPFRS